MFDRNLESLTLREKLIEAERVSRELADHLERAVLPKIQSLRRIAHKGTEPDTQDEVRDITVRNAVEQVLQSDDYTRRLSDWCSELLAAIERDAKTVVEEGA